ncbi:hypothetical protein E1757_07080 [Paenibacillus piri]|uniref:Pilus assembly protein n=1 Tax=Paenibacillus piri TaxID=2547395 RepID=A0A4R5KVR8_9BACL|nr:hypothetical protein E1757_07080 [Paenibacillus piri]
MPHLGCPKRLLKESNGGFTIEASFVLPLLLLSTLSLLFLALFVFQTSAANHTAGLAADRSAFVWDNSKRDPITGSFSAGEGDGLYWRLSNDSVSDLFRFLIPNAASQIALPVSGISASDGPEGKLRRVGSVVSPEWNGIMNYRNNGFSRVVTVQLDKPFHSPGFAERNLLDKVESSAQAYVVEPVESIRIIDLTRTFIQDIKDRIKPDAALQLMKEPQTVPDKPAVINSHKSAVAYLQTLVNGSERTIQVNKDTKRQVDAMDANQVAHQAFYTFSESQLRNEQLPKDVQLLNNGTEVKGVVWHFFKQAKNSEVKLSARLRAELERNGIVVVIHE